MAGTFEPMDRYGTVGAVAMDTKGNLAAATSTGGVFHKMPGRVGDSPIIGAGTFADNATCAVSGTGHGEYFIRAGVAHAICDRIDAYSAHGYYEAHEQEELKAAAREEGAAVLISHSEWPPYAPVRHVSTSAEAADMTRRHRNQATVSGVVSERGTARPSRPER